MTFFSNPRNVAQLIVGVLAVGVTVWVLKNTTAFQRTEDMFTQTCQVKLSLSTQEAFQNSNVRNRLCDELRQSMFKSEDALEELLPEDLGNRFGAAPMGVDEQVKFVLFSDPRFVATSIYCYYVFSGSLKLSQLSPQQFALGVGGFSVLRSSLQGYTEWLLGPDGLACREKIKSGLHDDVIDLTRALGDSIAMIGINPVGAISLSMNADELQGQLKQEIAQTLNHERIHAVQSICPSLNRLAISDWTALPEEVKAKIRAEHAGYNWDISEVAAREFQAITYEQNPTKVAELAGDCNASED